MKPVSSRDIVPDASHSSESRERSSEIKRLEMELGILAEFLEAQRNQNMLHKCPELGVDIESRCQLRTLYLSRGARVARIFKSAFMILTSRVYWRRRLSIDYGTRRLFDGGGYLELNPDVMASNYHPWLHYVLFGISEGREFQSSLDMGQSISSDVDVWIGDDVPS